MLLFIGTAKATSVIIFGLCIDDRINQIITIINAFHFANWNFEKQEAALRTLIVITLSGFEYNMSIILTQIKIMKMLNIENLYAFLSCFLFKPCELIFLGRTRADYTKID